MRADEQHAETNAIALGDRVSVSGVSWHGGVPTVRARRNGAASIFVPLLGLTLQYAADSARRTCIGHKPFRDSSASWVDCDNAPLRQGHKCDRCTANDATFASQLHHAHTRGAGELDASVQAHLKQENHLYLAGFRDGSIKVGTSTSTRLNTRLAEQGAWQAEVVATTTNGITVREIESLVTSDLGISQSVSARRKLAGLVAPVDDERVGGELSRWADAVHQLIERFDSNQISTPSLVSTVSQRWENPAAHDELWANVIEYPLDLTSGCHNLEVRGAIGRHFGFTRPGANDVFVADLRHLYGFEIEMASVDADELTVQDSLF